VIEIDQSPIGRTPRSNPATYTGAFDGIRRLFAQVPEARVRGYGPGRFSFNVKGGRCEACQGDGLLRIEMHFLPDLYVTCETCRGRRYNRETLEILYKNRNIADVLEMTVEEALEFMSNVGAVRRPLQTLFDVGLGYVHLGQSATTLSGGEAQRIKLARELSRKSTGRTLYLLDEPTTGLHFADVQKLLEVLSKLVDAGNSVVVIEHHPDVIKTADHVIDLGPEGGEKGGRIVAEGTPEAVAQNPESHTGRALAPRLFSR
jgi:excinuclease ABC subunit A